jgi:valyl-tRNA synthetase
MTIRPEQDVMDTWMTSSVSPYINLNWAGQGPGKGDMSMMPMSLRVQAFEIIRTWLFYTLVKAHFHRNELPWTSVMISGWGLNEQGKKIAKRDLEASTDASGYNRYVPDAVIEKYGADALRYWAAAARLGNDLRYNEKDVRAGRKFVVKLFNVAKLAATNLADFDVAAPPVPLTERAIEDRWMLGRLDQVTEQDHGGIRVVRLRRRPGSSREVLLDRLLRQLPRDRQGSLLAPGGLLEWVEAGGTSNALGKPEATAGGGGAVSSVCDGRHLSALVRQTRERGLHPHHRLA